MCRWAVFISGRGSNLSALLDIRDTYPIGLVVSSRAKAPGLEFAKKASVPTFVLGEVPNWSELYGQLDQAGITHIFLAGFLKILPDEFLRLWKKPMLNLHPSLLPAYPGLKSIERAYKDNAAIGVTIHQVVAEVDSGDTLLQEELFPEGEAQRYSLEEVRSVVHKKEHEMVCRAVEVLCKTS